MLRWAAVALCMLQGGFMALDGVRALLTGRYITPGGDRADELGPWSRLVSALGLAPESTVVKAVFVAYGVLWLVLAIGLVLHAGWAWPLGVVMAVGTLWYLVPGTVLSLLVLGLLLTPSVRHALGRG